MSITDERCLTHEIRNCTICAPDREWMDAFARFRRAFEQLSDEQKRDAAQRMLDELIEVKLDG